jgi:hypothetical protein
MKQLMRVSVNALRHLRLLALHLAVNGVIVVAAALWLLIPEQHWWQLLLTALIAAAVFVAAVWLHAGTLAYFAASAPARGEPHAAAAPATAEAAVAEASAAHPEADFRTALWRGLRNAPPFVVAVAIMVLLMCWVGGWSERMWQISGYVYVKLPIIHGIIGPTGTYNFGIFIVNLLFWYLIPAVLLPFAAGAAAHGFSSQALSAGAHTLRRLAYWVWLGILELPGVLLPTLLLDWSPRGTLRLEMTSLFLRLGFAWLLAVAAWLMIAGMLGHLVASTKQPARAAGKELASSPL